MPDDPNKSGKADRGRINIHEDYELRDWSESLGVSKEELIKAVKKSWSDGGGREERVGKIAFG
jgi:hypothetical protein